MATLYIAEFCQLSAITSKIGDEVQVALQPAITEQTVAIGGASVPSAAFNALTKFIRIHCDVICSIKIGANPIATTSTARMAANQTEYFGVRPGDQIAVISNV